jgi:hypothetical protein
VGAVAVVLVFGDRNENFAVLRARWSRGEEEFSLCVGRRKPGQLIRAFEDVDE